MRANVWVTAAAAAALAALLALPAGALGQPDITADTTMGEIRANESLIAAGFDTHDRNILLPEQPWMYDDWTLRQYLGGTAPDAAAGLNLVIDNYNHGVQVTYKLYTPEEIAADPRKDEVELYYFPAKGGSAAPVKYALVVPGNMYEKSAKMREGCSVSYQMHEMGYAAFVLRYSVGHDNTDNAAYEDLVRAVRFITAHAEDFGVQAEDYALVGFSAGGQMCGVFGSSRLGYKARGLPMMMDIFRQGPALDKALEEAGVMHKMVVYPNARHRSSVGTGTDAAGWLADGAAFWEAAVAAQK